MKVAVIGASGVVGRALLEALDRQGIESIALSRRAPHLLTCEHVPLDLQDAKACRKVVGTHFRDVTHIVYAALFEEPGLIAGWRHEAQMQTNLAMLENLLMPVLEVSKDLRCIQLLQGTKAYGAHIAPMKIPGRESEPRHPHANFYWLQEDCLKSLQPRADFSYTIWRPQIIFGHALHAPMNMLAAIGVYAALQKDRGLPLSYPGGPSGVMEAIDADLLANAMVFSLDDPAFENETFNITNGDVFTWENLWPDLAGRFGMETGPDVPRAMAGLYEEEDHWQRIVARNGLLDLSIRDLVGDSFHYADALFNTGGDRPPPPALVSTIKLRQAGFHECMDTTAMLGKWFDRLREMKILPG